MPEVFVVIPWRDVGNDLHRRAAFDYVQRAHRRLGHHLVIADQGEPFTRARALNLAIEQLPTDAIVVHCDADAFLPQPIMYSEAIRAARAAHGLVVPHDRYLFLTERVTDDVLAGRRPVITLDRDDCDWLEEGSVSLVTVYTRETWELAHGYDERFPIWGGEDAAFAYATSAFTEPIRRLPGDVIHLWHPRPESSIPGNPGYSDQFAIVAEYRDAAAEGPDAVRRLVHTRSA